MDNMHHAGKEIISDVDELLKESNLDILRKFLDEEDVQAVRQHLLVKKHYGGEYDSKSS